MITNHMLQVATLSDLKAQAVGSYATALLLSKMSLGDNQGGFYYWDPAATGAEDTVYLNIIPSSMSATGRWVRIFQRANDLPHGTLTRNGPLKTFFTNGTTDANGEISLNLTMDNTVNGEAIFTNIKSIIAEAQNNATGPSTAVQSYRKSVSTNLKQATYGFYRANAVTVTLGLLYAPFASTGAGIPVQFRIEGF